MPPQQSISRWPCLDPEAIAGRDPALGSSLALHGDSPDLHDPLVTPPGDLNNSNNSFNKILAALRTAGRPAIGIEIPIVAANLPALPRIVDLALAHRVARVVLIHPAEAPDIPLDALLPAICDAITRCQAAGVQPVVRGLPACLLPDAARELDPSPAPRLLLKIKIKKENFACLFEAHCDLSERCPGLAHAYIRRFGWEERRLRPLPPTSPWRAPAPALVPSPWLALLGPAAAAVESLVLDRRAARYTLRLGPGVTLLLELTPHDDHAPRYTRTRSFDIRYIRPDPPADPRAIARLLAPIVANITHHDDGTLSLDPRHGLAPLPPR